MLCPQIPPCWLRSRLVSDAGFYYCIMNGALSKYVNNVVVFEETPDQRSRFPGESE